MVKYSDEEKGARNAAWCAKIRGLMDEWDLTMADMGEMMGYGVHFTKSADQIQRRCSPVERWFEGRTTPHDEHQKMRLENFWSNLEAKLRAKYAAETEKHKRLMQKLRAGSAGIVQSESRDEEDS